MQNFEVQEFAGKVSLMLPDSSKRRLILPVLVGMAIGNHLIPKLGQELNPITVFADAHAGNVARTVSFLNEEMLIDVPAACEAAKMMFLLRSRILNGEACDYNVNPEFDFMATAMGVAPIMPLEIWNAIKEVGMQASGVLQLANLLICKLRANSKISLA
jgi:hypothetical protein